MWIIGEMMSRINGHYSYYPSSSMSIPLRDALLGILVGVLMIIWRRDRSRQHTKLLLILAFVFGLLGTTIYYLFTFLSHMDVSFLVWGDVLETAGSALFTSLLLDQVWKWYLKEECRWMLESFFQWPPTVQTTTPYPLMDKLTRTVASVLLILSFIGVIASGIVPDAPQAKSVIITLVPRINNNGIIIYLSLPVHKIESIQDVPDEGRPNHTPSVHQVQTALNLAQESLHLQEKQQNLWSVDNSIHCQISTNRAMMTARCQELVYDSITARASGVDKLQHTPLPVDLNGYQNVGPTTTHIFSAQLSANGTARIYIDASSSWAYAFSPGQLQQLASQLAGRRENEADALLRSQVGIETVWLNTVGLSLPADPHHIYFQILIQR